MTLHKTILPTNYPVMDFFYKSSHEVGNQATDLSYHALEKGVGMW